jgi:hypothetical protein
MVFILLIVSNIQKQYAYLIVSNSRTRVICIGAVFAALIVFTVYVVWRHVNVSFNDLVYLRALIICFRSRFDERFPLKNIIVHTVFLSRSHPRVSVRPTRLAQLIGTAISVFDVLDKYNITDIIYSGRFRVFCINVENLVGVIKNLHCVFQTLQDLTKISSPHYYTKSYTSSKHLEKLNFSGENRFIIIPQELYLIWCFTQNPEEICIYNHIGIILVCHRLLLVCTCMPTSSIL